MRSRLASVVGLATCLFLAVVATSCGGRSNTDPSATGVTLGNFQIRPLTAESTDRTVEWMLTARVTGSRGKLTGGHFRIRPAGAALQPSSNRGRAPLAVGRSVRQAEATCVLDGECAVELTRTSCASEQECNVEGVWRVDRPQKGRYTRSVAFVQSDGTASNEISFVVEIKEPPPAPPPPPSPPPLTFSNTIGVTFLHPRCANCHGFQVPNVIGSKHATRPTTCTFCHPLPTWHAPPASFDLVSKTLPQICEMIKATRGNNPAAIEDHLKNDALIQWAISDGIVEGHLSPGGLAPPGNLGAWNNRIDQWIAGGLTCR